MALSISVPWGIKNTHRTGLSFYRVMASLFPSYTTYHTTVLCRLFNYILGRHPNVHAFKIQSSFNASLSLSLFLQWHTLTSLWWAHKCKMTLGGRQEVSNLIQMVTGHILAKFVTLATISMRRLQSFLICFELVCGIAVLLVLTGLALTLHCLSILL